MSGYTKGPWRIEEGTTLVWGKCNPDDTSSYGMGYPITDCRIIPISNSAWCKGPLADEGEANARLIAAAPELLEALEEMVRRCDLFPDADYNLRAQAAIKKAKGE